MMTANETPSSSARTDVGSVLWGLIWDGVAAATAMVVREIRIRRAMLELSAMGENVLQDIGLTRDDVERVVRHGRT